MRSSASRASAGHATGRRRTRASCMRSTSCPSCWDRGIGRALLERAEESMREYGFGNGQSCGCWRETNAASSLSIASRRLGARRPQARHVPGCRGLRAQLSQGPVAAQLSDEEEGPGAEHEHADHDASPVDGRRAVVDARQREECRRIDLRAEARPPLPAHASEAEVRFAGRPGAPTRMQRCWPRTRPRSGSRCHPCRPARRGRGRPPFGPRSCARARCRRTLRRRAVGRGRDRRAGSCKQTRRRERQAPPPPRQLPPRRR